MMSSPAAFGQWPGNGGMHTPPPPPPPAPNNGNGEDGITVKPMRLKVLYTFDDQNKTNCLARYPHVLQIQTIMMEDGAIGVVELKTCIQAIVECSPELVAKMGHDYTVYAFDYSEYDSPLVGQGMLSRVLQAAFPKPDVPAEQSEQLVTGRVQKNIRGLLNRGGLEETLEVKLRLVPVPTSLQNEYQSTMDKLREANRSVPPPGYDPNEWTSLIQSTPNFGQPQAKTSLPTYPQQTVSSPYPQSQPNVGPTPHPNAPINVHPNSHHNGQPSMQGHPESNPHQQDARNLGPGTQQYSPALQPHPNHHGHRLTPEQSVTMNPAPIMEAASTVTNNGGKARKPASRPASRASVKRPRKSKAATPTVEGNTSGYEEGTDGDDGPAPKRRAKITKATDFNQRNSFGSAPESLRVAASTAASVRLFRPIAMSPSLSGGTLQEVPRAPTPVPRLPQHQLHQQPQQSSLRRDSFAQEPTPPPRRFISPYTQQSLPEDDLRYSIESAGPSPDHHDSPAETPPEFNSSPPVMRTRPPSVMRSSPPCPTSPCLPPMPRTDSGFMSGSMEELFGEDDDDQGLPVIDDDDDIQIVEPQDSQIRRQSTAGAESVARLEFQGELHIQQVYPGPMELLPTTTKPHRPVPFVSYQSQAGGSRPGSRGGPVMSEDGAQSLPHLRTGSQPVQLAPTMLQSPRPADSAEGAPIQMANVSPCPPISEQPCVPPNPLQLPLSAKQTPQQALEAIYSPVNQQTPSQQMPVSRQSSVEQNAATQATGQFPQSAVQPPQYPETQAPIKAPSPGLPNLPLAETGRRKSVPKSTAPPTQQSRGPMMRTASLGSLTLPQIPASDPVLPPSGLHRSQTWSEAPHAMTEGPMPMMHDMQQLSQPPPEYGEPGVPYNRTWNAKKAAIRTRLENAILAGEMPPYCCNCGVIETPTWRKAWARVIQGAPGYYEYSEGPGRVTAVAVLTRDDEGIPTSFHLIKKILALGQDDPADFTELTLCNPCGIWMSKHKNHRPPEKWNKNAAQVEKKVPEKKKPPPRAPRTRKPKRNGISEPPVDFGPQHPTDGPSPTDTTGIHQFLQPQQADDLAPPKRLNAMTSTAAPDALRRALQSSPQRWDDSRRSPVDVEDVGTTRRLLFPSPRKDGSPKVLGETATTTRVVQIAASYTTQKEVMVEAANKENCPPFMIDDNDDDEFMRMFEEEMARPSTPVQKTPTANPFKTPTRPTPNHRPITRSVSKSGSKSKSTHKSPSDHLLVTPSQSVRRSPRNHNSTFMSPFTASINQMMSDANDHAQSPSQSAMELDFGTLPDLPLGNHGNMEPTFTLEDFFSTDVPMPSSPPRTFRLYEDPISMNNINWDEFNSSYDQDLGAGAAQEATVIKKEPQDSPQKRGGEKSPGEKEVA